MPRARGAVLRRRAPPAEASEAARRSTGSATGVLRCGRLAARRRAAEARGVAPNALQRPAAYGGSVRQVRRRAPACSGRLQAPCGPAAAGGGLQAPCGPAATGGGETAPSRAPDGARAASRVDARPALQLTAAEVGGTRPGWRRSGLLHWIAKACSAALRCGLHFTTRRYGGNARRRPAVRPAGGRLESPRRRRGFGSAARRTAASRSFGPAASA